MYQIIDEKIIGRKVDTNSDFLQLKVVHIVCDTAASVPEPLPEWAAGSRCDVLADSGTVYILSISGEWKQVNFYNRGGEGGGFDPDAYYTKPQTDARITEKVAEIVADAPEDFDTLKEMSDWIDSHEDSASAMNSAIQQNTTAIAGKVDKVAGKSLSTNDYTTEEKTKLAGIPANASDVGQLYPNSNHGEIFNNYENSARPNVASGDYSHAEGGDNTASGTFSHVEGAGNTVSGNFSHAEGGDNTASGAYSHAQGYRTLASGNYSHVEGDNTIAASDVQHVQGKYNVADTDGKFAFIIGNGTHRERRSNAFAIDWNGLIYQNNSETGIDLSTLSSNVDNKVDKVSGKGLSTNDYTTEEKTKLAGIETGAKVNIQPDWEQSDNAADDFIKNKPTLGSAASRSVVLSLSNAGSGLPTSGTVYSALQTKVDKVSGKGLSTNDYTTEEKTKLSEIESGANKTVVDSALSSSSTNPVQNKVVNAPIVRMVDAGAKNLLKITAESQTKNGLTFTVLSDTGTITINGTAEANTFFTLTSSFLLPIGVFNLSGCPSEYNHDGARECRLFTEGTSFEQSDIGEGTTYTMNEATTKIIMFEVYAGTVMNNAVIKPMLCAHEDYIVSSKFVPYAPTNRELYEMILALTNN